MNKRAAFRRAVRRLRREGEPRQMARHLAWCEVYLRVVSQPVVTTRRKLTVRWTLDSTADVFGPDDVAAIEQACREEAARHGPTE